MSAHPPLSSDADFSMRLVTKSSKVRMEVTAFAATVGAAREAAAE